jgi:hypothetical protein
MTPLQRSIPRIILLAMLPIGCDSGESGRVLTPPRTIGTIQTKTPATQTESPAQTQIPTATNDAGEKMADKDGRETKNDGSAPPPLGGCVIERRDGSVPADLRRHTAIVRDDRYAPFRKHLIAGGIVFIATDEVEDSFMIAVGDLHAAMFDPDPPGIDRGLQDAVLTSMFEARTTIPMWKGEEPDFPEESDWEEFDRLHDRLSICDAIFQLDRRDRDGQPMEVVEHLLHHLNMVGIHEVFPDEWGITSESILHGSMRKALDESWYVVDYLDEFDDESEAQRVLLQEYSYWVISTEWDLQRPFGPDAENGEWNLSDPERFRALQPELHAAFDRTIPKVLTPPNRAALAAFAD